MSVKEKFEKAYENIIEDCSGEVLEGFDFLLAEIERLEETNDNLRARIASLEKENNILKIFYSENEINDASVGELEGVITDIEDASTVLGRINEILDNAKRVFSDMSDSLTRCITSKNECDLLLSGTPMTEPEEYSDSDEIPEEPICDEDDVEDEAEETQNEEIVDEPAQVREIVDELEEGEAAKAPDPVDAVEEPAEPEKVESTKDEKSENAELDITEQLKNMLADAPESDEADAPAPDDVSELIMRMLNIQPEETRKKAPEKKVMSFEEAVAANSPEDKPNAVESKESEKIEQSELIEDVKISMPVKTEKCKETPSEPLKPEVEPVQPIPAPAPEVNKPIAPAPQKKIPAKPAPVKRPKVEDDFWDENGMSEDIAAKVAREELEERSKPKPAENANAQQKEKKDDIKSIKDSLLKIKNKRKGL